MTDEEDIYFGHHCRCALPAKLWFQDKKKSPYRYIPREWMIFTRSFPFVRRLCFSPAGKYKFWKGVVGFIFGTLVAYVIGVSLIGYMPLHPETDYYLKLSIFTVLSTSNALSSQARCLTLLLIPTILSKSGARFMKTVVMALVIAGPVENLLLNARQVVNSITCTTDLVRNLTLTKYKLTFEPYQHALMNLKVDINEVLDTMGSVKEIIAPLVHEMMDETEIRYLKDENDYIDDLLNNTRRSQNTDIRYEHCVPCRKSCYKKNSKFKWTNAINFNGFIKSKKTCCRKQIDAASIEELYMKKLEHRCNNLITATIKQCSQIFGDAYDRCYRGINTNVAWVLCWPLHPSYVCNTVSILGGENACVASKWIPRGWGRGMITLIKTKEALTQTSKTPEVVYKVEKPVIQVDADKLIEQAGDLKQIYEDKSLWYMKFMNIFQVVMNLIFLKVIYDTFDYNQRYLTNIEFENIYVSRYFKKIDSRRRACKKHTLLPFKNREKRRFIFPTRIALQSREIDTAGYGLMCLLPLVFFTTGIVFIDRAFTEALDVVTRNARVEFVSTGSQEMKVKGTGMAAKIVRSVVNEFYHKRELSEVHNNEECLPKPQYLKTSTLYGMIGVIITCAVFLVMEGYGSRMKWAICGFFYPKRAKKRTLFLYNDTLKTRKVFFKYMNTKVKRLIRANKLDQDTSTLLLLSMKYPCYFGWLALFFQQARRKCLICRESEDLGLIANNITMYECQNCLYVYCKECYYDIGQRCHRCRPLSVDDDSDPDSVLAKSDKSD